MKKRRPAPEAQPLRAVRAQATAAALDALLNMHLRQVHDDFLPAAEYISRADVAHYRDVNTPVDRTRSPWGDWESTLTA